MAKVFLYLSFYFLPTDLAKFPVPDPHVQTHFKFNDYTLVWTSGYPPHFEPVLTVCIEGQRPRIIGRYIASCQVRPRKSLFQLPGLKVNEGVRDCLLPLSVLLRLSAHLFVYCFVCLFITFSLGKFIHVCLSFLMSFVGQIILSYT